MKTLQERLRYARENKGYSQMEVSRRAGINNKTLSGYENGVSEPDAVTLSKLAELYDVTTDWLITGRGPAAQPDDDAYKDLDRELVKALRAASPEDQEHFRKYLRGEVEDPVWFSETEKSFERDLQEGIDIMALFDKYTFTLGGITPTKEELEELAKYLKAIRIMKMM